MYKKLSTCYRILSISCLVVIVIGCLLPWGCSGDFITVCESGIFLSIHHGFHFESNGGIFVLFLSLLTIGLANFGLHLFKKSGLLASISSVILLIYITIIFGYWIMRGSKENGLVGAASPGFGLGLTLIGSIFLLFLTIYGVGVIRE